MKLKYYLRGLGIGIIITVIIMMIAFHVHGSDMTDEEVIERAKQLGMVEAEDSGVVADQTTEGDTSDTSTNEASDSTSTSDTTKESTSDTDSTLEEESKSESTDEEETKSDESTSEETSSNTNETKKSKTVKVTINSGASSDTIAQLLYEKGIVDDAYAFNDYLVSNGYANVLRTGSFELPTGASYKKIAKLLTNK
ncbi:endolytic transglycosylase MltG [Eubacterium oxidoreducens]|uniref:YceG-like family protein n=1 Tax=Eubacterium oxidoreducens TaxID=1732 RepID=A0A1G6APA9_EUBOX|nr:endolytic transglycosylase MltG [Eubacterium oxidoreducens]SDB10258.1 YceG-like family protein [Eubacterium oxidoreducens]